MDFDISAEQRQYQAQGLELGTQLPVDASAGLVVQAAAKAGLIQPDVDLLAAVLMLDALAAESAPSAVALALHLACVRNAGDDPNLLTGTRVGALTLSTDEVPLEQDGRLTGRASWVGPATGDGLAIVGARRGSELVACAVVLSATGVLVEPVPVAGLVGLQFGHVHLQQAAATVVGPTVPVMSVARLFIAAVGLGVARRAVREAMGSARGTSQGAGGEQTTQGLIADAATERDAAMLLTWKAATGLSLASSSLAKLAATGAAQRAVERATQAIGAESFRRGHVLERLTQDVRALELFAGRTEALREAVAVDQGWTE